MQTIIRTCDDMTTMPFYLGKHRWLVLMDVGILRTFCGLGAD